MRVLIVYFTICRQSGLECDVCQTLVFGAEGIGIEQLAFAVAFVFLVQVLEARISLVATIFLALGLVYGHLQLLLQRFLLALLLQQQGGQAVDFSCIRHVKCMRKMHMKFSKVRRYRPRPMSYVLYRMACRTMPSVIRVSSLLTFKNLDRSSDACFSLAAAHNSDFNSSAQPHFVSRHPSSVMRDA